MKIQLLFIFILFIVCGCQIENQNNLSVDEFLHNIPILEQELEEHIILYKSKIKEYQIKLLSSKTRKRLQIYETKLAICQYRLGVLKDKYSNLSYNRKQEIISWYNSLDKKYRHMIDDLVNSNK